MRPDNWLKLIWDAFLLFFILLNTLIVPLNLCFGLELLSVNNIWFDIIELIMLYLITLDMFLSIFTAYYSEGVIITNKIRILKNYFSNSFLWDFLSITPYFLSPYFDNQYMKLFLMLSLIKMKKIFIGLEEHLFLSTKVKGIYELFKLLVLIIYVGHFFACFWIYIAKVEIELGAWNTWIQTFNLIHEKWYYQYISSLYFAVYTMVTVGYGDIYPTNILERTLSILLMLLACGVFAYSLNRFGTIVEEMYQYETQFK